MEDMMRLKDKLWDEIAEISRKPELGAGDLEIAHKLTDTIKNIDKICMLEEDESGEDGGYSGRHYVRGHYSNTGRGSYRGGSYAGQRRRSDGRYSRGGNDDDGRVEMMSYLSAAMSTTADENDREMIRRMMDQMRER